MAATVVINRWTGTSGAPTKTNITSANTRANAEDSPSSTTSNPVRVPSAGTNYSYWVATRLNCTVAPATLINNLQWYTSGTNNLGTGVGMNAATATNYAQATGTPGTTGTQLTVANYGNGTTDLDAAPSNAFAFVSGSALAVTGSTSTTGDFGHFVVYQITVGTTAGPGPTPQTTLTWSYDES